MPRPTSAGEQHHRRWEPFGEQEEVDLLVSPGETAWRGFGLLGTAIAMMWLAVRLGLHGDVCGLLTFTLMAIFSAFVAIRSIRLRVRFWGERFEVQGLWRDAAGSADEFIGWNSTVRGERLLRRKDLRWVYVPHIYPSELPDADTQRWLYTFVPGIYPTGVRKVRRGSDLPGGVARLWLEQPLPASSEEFYNSEADLQLACAARAVEKYKYFEARRSLEELLPRLPQPSVATPFVLDALRSIGAESSAAALASVATKYERSKEHHARALCALATVEQQDLLESLSRDSDRLVAREARRALERLRSQQSRVHARHEPAS